MGLDHCEGPIQGMFDKEVKIGERVEGQEVFFVLKQQLIGQRIIPGQWFTLFKN